MVYVFLYFFLPVSKKDTGFAKSQNENDAFVICCCYYYVSFILSLFGDSGSAGQMHS